MPLVSVIMPNLNGERFIAQAVRSVQHQSLADWELIIADDGSEDTSADVVWSIASDDVRVKFIASDEPRSGPAKTRNRALEAASGRFIAFLDNDDTWAPDKLEAQIALQKDKACKLTFTALCKMNSDGEIDHRVITPPQVVSYRKLLSRNHLICSSVIVDRERVGDFRLPDIFRRQDYGLWLKILRSGGEAHCVPRPLLFYRIYPESFSASKMVSARYHWKVLRELEHVHRFPAAFYFARYAIGAGSEYVRGRIGLSASAGQSAK